jgi:hypothetical protein
MDAGARYYQHSETAAEEHMTVANNGTWSTAYIIGKEGDLTWSFTDCQFELDVQRNRYDQVPLLSLTTGNGRVIVDDPIQRILHFNVVAADIQASLSPGIYVYDLVMIDVNGVRTPLMFGNLKIVQGVTYPTG